MSSRDAKTVEFDDYPSATRAKVIEDRLLVKLRDGSRLDLPLSWFPTLINAPRHLREHVQVISQGIGLRWPDLGYELGVGGLTKQRKKLWR